MDNLKEKAKTAFIWDFFGKMATHGMGFITTIFLARLLEPSDFGLIAIVMVIVGIANVFTDIGLGGALIQRRRLHPIHYSSVFYFNILAGSLLTLITYLSAPWISEFYEKEQLLPLVKVMSFSFILGVLSSVQRARLSKELNYSRLAKIRLTSSLISGIVGISLAFLGAGVWSLVAQSLTGGIISNILLWIRSTWRPDLEFSWKALFQLWSFGFRIFLSAMLDAVFKRFDFLIIGKLFPAEILGYFQRAQSLNNMVLRYTSGSLMTVLFPVLSKIQNDLPRFQNIIIKSLGIISVLVFFLLGTLYLISEELIVLLFSDKWLPSVDFFKILVLSGFDYPVSSILVNVLMSRGNSKAFFRLEIYKKVLLSLNLLVLYFWGINSFLYGMIIVSTLSVLLNALFASREIKLPFFLLVKPIGIQMGITIISVFLTVLITKDLALMNIVMLIIKGSIFTLFFISINMLFKTNSFSYFLEHIMPIIKKKFRKKVEN